MPLMAYLEAGLSNWEGPLKTAMVRCHRHQHHRCNFALLSMTKKMPVMSSWERMTRLYNWHLSISANNDAKDNVWMCVWVCTHAYVATGRSALYNVRRSSRHDVVPRKWTQSLRNANVFFDFKSDIAKELIQTARRAAVPCWQRNFDGLTWRFNVILLIVERRTASVKYLATFEI